VFITHYLDTCLVTNDAYPVSLVPIGNLRNRFALLTTVTDDNAIAAPAIIGLSNNPVTGNNTPAATGISSAL